MRICIDCRSMLSPPGGVHQYIRKLAGHLAMLDRENEYLLFHLNGFFLWNRSEPLSMNQANFCTREVKFPNRVFRYLEKKEFPPG